MGLAANIIFVLALVVLTAGGFYGTHYLNVGSGYTAKITCSGVLGAKRTLDSVSSEEFSFIPAPIFSVNVDGNSATASVFGFFARTAVYDAETNSCTLLGAGSEKLLHKKSAQLAVQPKKDEEKLTKTTAGVNSERLDTIIAAAFDEPTIKEAGFHRRTRAIIILRDGEAIAESYAPGFDQDTALIGWELTEALFAAVIQKRIDEGKLSLKAANLFPEWANDKRKEITVEALLKGTSGLSLDRADYYNMLFVADSAVDSAIKSSSIKSSKTTFSGSGNLLSRVLRNSFASQEEYWGYVRSFLNEIGLTKTVIDTDNKGEFVASAFAYGPARDWLKFGEFVRNRGNINGKQILSESFFDSLVATKSSTGPVNGWWLNNENQISDAIPKDAIFALGEEEQSLTIIPSRKLTILRLGCTQPGTVWNLTGFVSYLLDVVLTQ